MQLQRRCLQPSLIECHTNALSAVALHCALSGQGVTQLTVQNFSTQFMLCILQGEADPDSLSPLL